MRFRFSGPRAPFTRALALTVIALACLSGVAHAEKYPSRPVRLVLPFSAGGTTDVPGRVLAQRLSVLLGEQFFVDNRPGAGSTIGTGYVAKAKPDGYTLLLMSPTHVIAPHLYKSVEYDALKDFTPVAKFASGAYVVVAHPSLGVKTLPELIALAKAHPDQIDFASSGNGSTQHLVGALFASMAGIRINHIPYRGSGPATEDLVAGHVKLGFAGTPIAIPQIKSGHLLALAVTTPNRIAELPDVPTVAEAGVPGYDATVWLGLLAPAGTPSDIVALLNREMAQALEDPEARKQIEATGMEISLSSPEAFGQFLRAEYEKWGKVVRASGAAIN
jgi:tripartite-type tricarboxylate transporter receptor subunit TctC